MENQIYHHGTNQDFATFLRSPPRRSTHGASNGSGIFFSTSKAVSSQYAMLAQKMFYPDNHNAVERKISNLVRSADEAAKRRDFDTYERLTEEAGDLEAEMRQTEHGPRVLSVEIDMRHPKVLKEVGAIDLREMTEILSAAERDGHDAVIFEDIVDSVSELVSPEPYSHVVVFDPQICRIIDVEFMPASDGSLMPEEMAPIHRSMMRIVDPFEIRPEAVPERELEPA